VDGRRSAPGPRATLQVGFTGLDDNSYYDIAGYSYGPLIGPNPAAMVRAPRRRASRPMGR